MKHRVKQALGQVFIKDKNIIEKIIRFADLTLDDAVLEIGCGEGWLSRRLSESAGSLTIVELDERWLEDTQERLSDRNNVTFVRGDILKVEFEGVLAPKFKIVANIPYYISAKIIQLIVAHCDRVNSALLMLQKEFAQKLVAGPGDALYSSLAVYTQFYFKPSLEFVISKNSFRPVPKIDSAMLLLTPRLDRPADIDPTFFSAVVQTSFWGRRKPLLSCLRKSPFLNLKPGIETLPFFEGRLAIRGELLSLSEFEQLCRALKPYTL